MVFLDKPHIKQFVDIFDTSLKNIFIFKIYIYFYLLSIYKLSIHYLLYTNTTISDVLSSNFFLLTNILICFVSFIIIYQNYYSYPTNKISNIIFSLTNANTCISLFIKMYNHLFIIAIEIITNIILLSIVIYTLWNKSNNFIQNKLLTILFPMYFISFLGITYLDIITPRQIVYLLISSIIFLILQLQNIKIIVKRYMSQDFYLAYLNLYFIIIDTSDIFINIILQIFLPSYIRKKKL
jgi:hypothetical protein